MNDTTDIVRISHFGICVSDIERSTRFYTEALGFEREHAVDVAAPFHQLVELPEIKGRAQFLRRDSVRIELCAYERPDTFGPTERRAMNQIGLTHFALAVKDLDAVVGRITEHGGRVYPQTLTRSKMGDLIFCTDPDGVRIELWRKPA